MFLSSSEAVFFQEFEDFCDFIVGGLYSHLGWVGVFKGGFCNWKVGLKNLSTQRPWAQRSLYLFSHDRFILSFCWRLGCDFFGIFPAKFWYFLGVKFMTVSGIELTKF